MLIGAAVTRATGGPFTIENVELAGPASDEVLVRIVGTGICHTDLLARDGDYPMPLPAVLGHEGAGIVEEVGADVDDLVRGDHVVLTYRSCQRCPSCLVGKPGYCRDIFELTYNGARPDGTSALSQHGGPLNGHFFSQSSFAEYAIAHQDNAVKVREDVSLRALGPLGCGILTGFGAVVNSLGARPGSTIAILGAGTVGLSAIVGAGLTGCSRIVAVDVLPSRLQLAGELGATDLLEPRSGAELTEQLLEIAPGGLDYALDMTGLPEVVRAAVHALAPLGIFGQVGGSRLGTEVSLDLNTMLFGGRTFRGVIGGDSVPKLAIPALVELYASGRLPLDRLITFYPLDRINEAVADTKSGKAVKAVLLPPD